LWSFKGAQSSHTNLTIKVDIKEDKDEFLDVIRKDRPWLSLIDILQFSDLIRRENSEESGTENILLEEDIGLRYSSVVPGWFEGNTDGTLQVLLLYVLLAG
jgi:hypothetical protein